MLLPVIDWKNLWENRGTRIALISLGALLGVGGISLGGYYLWPEPAPKPPPPVETATVKDTLDYAATEDFRRLPTDKRMRWVEGQIQKLGQMSDDEFVETWKNTDKATRDRIRENVRIAMQERTKKDVQQFFKLPKSEREAFLDKRIDEINIWEPRMHKIFGRGRRGPGTTAPALSDQDREFRKQEREARQAQFMGESYRFMAGETADQRGMSLAFFAEMGRRRAERGESNFFGRKPKPKPQQK